LIPILPHSKIQSAYSKNLEVEFVKVSGKQSVLVRTALLWIAGFIALIISNSSIAYGQWLENFGYLGAVKELKGQVREGDDTPIPRANIKITNLATGKVHLIEADKDGCYRKAGLLFGIYKVTVNAQGHNVGEFTVTINTNDSSANAKRYTVVRLSPGCASGNSGVALVGKLSDPSFH
jgi:hypothetical protein